MPSRGRAGPAKKAGLAQAGPNGQGVQGGRAGELAGLPEPYFLGDFIKGGLRVGFTK